MGEEPFRIFITGSPSIETILNAPLLSRDKLIEKLKLNPGKKIILLVQHPISTCPEKAAEEMQLTLDSVIQLGHQVVLIYPNMDPGGVLMIEKIKEYEGLYPDVINSFKNISFEHYLSLMMHSEFMIGNSSSGIIESPSFHIPVINIGSRQEGRERSDNVIDVGYDKKEIAEAIEKVLNDDIFKKIVSKCINPYGDGSTSNLICNTLENINIDQKLLVKKLTYD
jgi:UDP-hydrolysing UDP-N-acetyl-D-glucosamine 2-epimerase